eukprot:364522-Chlamydomonas_euryale.AAC.18
MGSSRSYLISVTLKCREWGGKENEKGRGRHEQALLTLGYAAWRLAACGFACFARASHRHALHGSL